MKHFFSFFFVGLLVLFLTGCAGLDVGALSGSVVKLAEAVTDENTSTAKGSTAGMSSSDAANVLMTRDYYSAVKSVAGADKTQKAQPLVEIESRDGKPITIDAKTFRVYAPTGQGGGAAQVAVQPPKEVESAGIKWFREIVRAGERVFVPWAVINEGGQTTRHVSDNNTATRQAELGAMNNATTGATGVASQAVTTFAPFVVEVPAAP